MSGGVRNVFAQNLVVGTSGVRIENLVRLKTGSQRGSYIENVVMRDVTVGQLTDSVLQIDLTYTKTGLGFDPMVSGIYMQDVTADITRFPLYLVGYPEDHIGGVLVTDVHIGTATQKSVRDYVDALTLRDVTVGGQPVTAPA